MLFPFFFFFVIFSIFIQTSVIRFVLEYFIRYWTYFTCIFLNFVSHHSLYVQTHCVVTACSHWFWEYFCRFPMRLHLHAHVSYAQRKFLCFQLAFLLFLSYYTGQISKYMLTQGEGRHSVFLAWYRGKPQSIITKHVEVFGWSLYSIKDVPFYF